MTDNENDVIIMLIASIGTAVLGHYDRTGDASTSGVRVGASLRFYDDDGVAGRFSMKV